MATTLSRRAYARHRGCDEKAVRKALGEGRIHEEADGKIDPERADAEWAANTNSRLPTQTSGAGRRGGAKPKAKSQPSKRRSSKRSSAAGTSSAEPSSTPTPEGIMQARLDKLEVEVEHTRIKMDRLRGNLVDKHQAKRHVFDFFRQERDAWLAVPARESATTAVALSVTQEAVHAVLEGIVHRTLMAISRDEPRLG